MVAAFAGELIALAERICAVRPPARVHSLHLPERLARDAKESEFCALELDDGSIGLSYLLLGDTPQRMRAAAPGAGVTGRSALEVARRLRGQDPVDRVLGLAAVNAICQGLLLARPEVLDWTSDPLGLLDPRPGDRIGMVGLFGGLASRIVAAGAQLVVIELDPALAGPRDGYEVTLDRGALGACNKVLSTTTLALNDTLDEVLEACRGADSIALVGPGGGFLPDPLFARGVTLLGGSAVVDRDAFVGAAARGEPWGGSVRKYCIRRESYPGVEALLAAAG
ncbi:Rossmann-like domain-containing protein [Quisquiliibacterium transsilvanicum]|uniref:Uncharacterized protein (DUF4213/DUF364 family) n=1 Tax=Quisquiliibacterium transsilvanicum TaxID=1549638 RepID=A0A7W8M835_9BURK|nr:DUF364 domain-containing protein [Quisquiliibacterium transsilvanicum]MBB5271423.1 uncharacterized protein (DUF4213/DUF364 family) [Quisquiliibacterium transsilvanicum]